MHLNIVIENLSGVINRLFLVCSAVGVIHKQRQHGFSQTGQVPLANRGLVDVSVSPLLINRAENFFAIKRINKRAGAVINCLAADGHIVGVHHAMNKSKVHPGRN